MLPVRLGLNLKTQRSGTKSKKTGPKVTVREGSMEVKWQYTETAPEIGKPQTCLNAILVDNRNEKGHRTEYVIAGLGSIELRFLNVNIANMRQFARGLFWSKLDDTLNHLSLTAIQKVIIEEAVSQKVPKPLGSWALWSVTCVPRYDS